ncbi:hypothetical protein KEU06_19680 [Pseudaminobacter sp. 19-2017]|uniref:Uncharacterized protein n=1 Tax=Pseudaminobacter soli (ex Zhang et al. 2022) TaxID=2831468 RepID=A0A942E5C3_9HYPH|nr:hypothetical protein [Pseudaminobacter soli]MBS3650835.1 hypothetical protein [Pseudaminobacter soli]
MSIDRADKDHTKSRKLSETIREVKNAAADRADVVVELRDATSVRLQLLAAELAPVFAEVPSDADIFDFALSSGLQPRLWIDAISHVAMGRDHRTYRFIRDTRNGRIVLAESPKIAVIVEAVTRYVAERIVEREQFLQGEVEPAIQKQFPAQDQETIGEPATGARRRGGSFLGGVLVFVSGFGFGLAVAIALLWQQLTGSLQ